jgi:hypothetical protein
MWAARQGRGCPGLTTVPVNWIVEPEGYNSSKERMLPTSTYISESHEIPAAHDVARPGVSVLVICHPSLF